MSNTPRPPKAVAYHILQTLINCKATVKTSRLLEIHPELDQRSLHELLIDLTECCMRERLPMLTTKVISDNAIAFGPIEKEWLAIYIEQSPYRLAEWIAYNTILMAQLSAKVTDQHALHINDAVISHRLSSHIDQLYKQN